MLSNQDSVDRSTGCKHACELSTHIFFVHLLDRDAQERLIDAFGAHVKDEHREGNRIFNYPQQGKVDVAKITVHRRLNICFMSFGLSCFFYSE